MVLCFIVLFLFLMFKNYHKGLVENTMKQISNSQLTLQENVRQSKLEKPVSSLDTSLETQFTTLGWKKLVVNQGQFVDETLRPVDLVKRIICLDYPGSIKYTIGQEGSYYQKFSGDPQNKVLYANLIGQQKLVFHISNNGQNYNLRQIEYDQYDRRVIELYY